MTPDDYHFRRRVSEGRLGKQCNNMANLVVNLLAKKQEAVIYSKHFYSLVDTSNTIKDITDKLKVPCYLDKARMLITFDNGSKIRLVCQVEKTYGLISDYHAVLE